jgi:hypothetical protein
MPMKYKGCSGKPKNAGKKLIKRAISGRPSGGSFTKGAGKSQGAKPSFYGKGK